MRTFGRHCLNLISSGKDSVDYQLNVGTDKSLKEQADDNHA